MLTRALVDEELSYGDAGIALGLPGSGAAGCAILELGTERRPFWGPAGRSRGFLGVPCSSAREHQCLGSTRLP